MAKFSRRALLGAGVAAGTAALAGCAGGSSVSFASWTPERETWPLARYGAGNSGHNPNAAPPHDGVTEAWRVQTDVSAWGLVVAHGQAVAHGPQGMVVLATSDPADRWAEYVPTETAGFGPRDEHGQVRLYAAGRLGQRDDTPVGLARGWASLGDRRSQSFWTTYEFESGRPGGLVTSEDTLYLGHRASGGLLAMSADGGGTRWQAHGAYPALADGRLVAGAYTTLTGYRPRGGLDARLNGGPAEAWTATGGLTPPALVDGRVIAGAGVDGSDYPNLFGYDAETGERLWEPRTLGDGASAPAVVGETGYVGASTYTDVGPYRAATAGALVALDLTDGSTRWRRETDWWHHAPVAGGNGVVIAYGGAREGERRGRLRAYDAETGETLWTHLAPGPVDGVALVGSTVYAGSRDGTVYALRAAE